MHTKILIALALVFLPGVNLVADVTDTLDLREVKVVYLREQLFRDGQQITLLGKEELRQYVHTTLDELISLYIPSGILSYGSPGSLSTLRMRGTGSNHTRVSWNGLPLNSPTTGITDLSLFPAAMADQVSIIPGATGSLSGNSTFGGAVCLSSEPDWTVPIQLGLNTETGSFGSRKVSLAGEGGNSRIQTDVRLLHHRARNNFPFTDIYKPGSPLVTQVHDAFSHTAFMQNTYLRLPASQEMRMGVWYQSRHKEIPSIMGSYTGSNAMQRDSSLRMYLSWKKLFRTSLLTLNASMANEFLRYIDVTAEEGGEGIHSFYHTRQAGAEAEFRHYFSENLILDAGTGLERKFADVVNYGKEVRETFFYLYTGLKWSPGPITTHLSFRQPFSGEYSMPVMVAASARLNLLPGRLWTGLQAGNRFRLPSLNERYWVPGGNTDLLPETGWGIEWGNDWYPVGDQHSGNSLLIRGNLFSSMVNNWIQWVPGDSYWSPVNHKNVWSRGMELYAIFRLKTAASELSGTVNYQYTRASDRGQAVNPEFFDNQLPYIPHHAAGMSLAWQYGKMGLRLSQQYTGRRYTTADNHRAYSLDDWFRTDLRLGYRFGLREWKADLGGQVQNIFNSEYQMIRSYALPGRAFFISLNIEWNKPAVKPNQTL